MKETEIKEGKRVRVTHDGKDYYGNVITADQIIRKAFVEYDDEKKEWVHFDDLKDVS